MTPLRSIVCGVAAGVAGTAAMDVASYRQYRQGGGEQRFWPWETAESVEKWDEAPAPAKVGRLLAAGFTDGDVPDQWARSLTNAVHWGTGLAWAVQYGITEGSLSSRRRRLAAALAFGPTAFLGGYVLLPLIKVYKPIWEYDAETLGRDLEIHLVYGAVTAAVFALLTARSRRH